MKLINLKYLFPLISLAIAIVVSILAAIKFLSMHHDESLFPSESLTKTERLSVYNPHLRSTRGDTQIYFFAGEQPGGKVLILGGTHPNEPAGFLTACLILENVRIERGTLVIIPRANNSAFSHNDPMEGQPQYFHVNTRKFRFGSRITNPIDQWPDPEIYLHFPSGQKLAGNETRNLNRAYPGRADGSLTERIAFAIINLIKYESIDLAFDLHEAAPEYPVVNALVATERSQDIASEAAIELEMEGLSYSLEPSPYNFHGLSHREWQDFTEVFPILLETANPVQGRLRGLTDEQLVVSGRDKMYLIAAKLGELHVPYDSTGIPLRLRVGRHLAAVKKIIDVFSNQFPSKTVSIKNIPSYSEIIESGLEPYFCSPE
jgi:hypothetical protein